MTDHTSNPVEIVTWSAPCPCDHPDAAPDHVASWWSQDNGRNVSPTYKITCPFDGAQV